jgi:VanZ family protein
MWKHYRYSIALCVIVALLSWVPTTSLPEASHISDKLIHFLMYFVLSCVIVLDQEGDRKDSKWIVISTMIFCTAYGLIMEVGQLYVPGRSFDWWDGVYNGLGGLAGSILSRFVINRIKL